MKISRRKHIDVLVMVISGECAGGGGQRENFTLYTSIVFEIVTKR